jgi:hypothetical protein
VDTTSTADASTDNPAGGSSDVGAAAGTQAGADTFAAEREQYEGRVRSFQSQADQASARVRALEAQLAEATAGAGGSGSDPDAAAGFDPDQIVSELESRFTHRTSMREAAAELASEFEYADEDILARAHEFESPEALREAIEDNHTAVTSFVSDIEARVRQEVLAEVNERYGLNLDVAPASTGDAPAGEPSVEEFASWSFGRQAEYEAENPGFTNRILRSANF